MSSRGCQGVGKETVAKAGKEERITRWADLVDDGDVEREEMDMSLLAEAIEECKLDDMHKGDGGVIGDGARARIAFILQQRGKNRGRDQAASIRDCASVKSQSAIEQKGDGKLDVSQRDQCTDRIKSSNEDDRDDAGSEEDTEMVVSASVAGKTPQRRQMHHVGDNVTSLCKTIQFVKVGKLPPPVKYRHRLPKEQKNKSDPNRWLKEALMDADTTSNTAGKAVHVGDRRTEAPSSAMVPRQMMASSAPITIQSPPPWDRRRETLSTRPSSPLARSVKEDRGGSHFNREHSPPSTYAHLSPFASLSRRHNMNREGHSSEEVYHSVEPAHAPYDRPRDRQALGRVHPSDLDGCDDMTLMSSPLPPPNFDAFYKRQKELQRELAALSAYSRYDVPPHLLHLYHSNSGRQRIVHDPSLAVHPQYPSYVPPPRISHQTYIEREPYPPHPTSMSFGRRREDNRPPSRLPPNGEPYGTDFDRVESSSSGVRRDDVVHARSYSNAHKNHPSEELHGNIDLLKRGILNRTLKD